MEEKQLNSKVVFLRRLFISVVAAVGSLFSSISCFGIEPYFEKISFTNIGSQLSNLLNEITNWMLINRGFVFKELEGSDVGYAAILLLLVALLALINYMIICSKRKKMLLMTVLPLTMAVLITEGAVSYLWIMVFTVAIGAMFAEMKNGYGANIWQVLVVACVAVLSAAVLSGDVTGKFFEKTDTINNLDSRIEKAVADRYYGENLLGNGVVGKENRDDTNKDELALKIQMTDPQSTYLRGFIGEMYSQGQWKTLPNGAYKETKNLLYWLNKEGFSALGQLSQLDSFVSRNNQVSQMTIQVENANKKYAYVPYEYVENKDKLFSKNGAFLTNGNIGRAKSYTYDVRENSVKHWTDTAGKFYTYENQKELEQYKINESYYNQMAYEYYTYLSVEEKLLLKEYVGDRGNQREGHVEYSEAISRVFNYLKENTYYTEMPAMENSEDTPLKTFFEKGKGYDVHYATAATLMFRYYGIPARYVEGYLVMPEDVRGKKADDVIDILQSNIHAWTEIYVDGIGFVPLEVSPKYKGVMEEADLTKGIENKAFKMDFENSNQKLESLKTLEKHQDKKVVSGIFAMIVIGLICIILSLLLLVFLYKISRKLINRWMKYQYFKNAEPKKAVSAMFEYMDKKGVRIDEEYRNLGNKAAFSKMEISEKERTDMLKYMKKVMSLLIVVAVSFTATSCGGSQPVNLNKEVETAAKWLMDATPAPCIGSIGGDWAVKGIASSGYDSSEMEAYIATYKEDVKAQTAMKKGMIDEEYYTSYARIAIGLKAVGENPLDVEGYNIVEKLDDYDKIMEQGVIGSSYALIGSKVSGYQLNNEKKYVDFLVNEINEQLLYEKEVWIDVVAMAVEALSFYSDREDVNATIEKCINGLSNQQLKDGSYGNCESTAEVIIALTMAGIDPMKDERFIKNGKNLGEGLLLFKGNEKYLHTVNQKESDANNMSTEKALLALAAMKLQTQGEKLY